MQQAVVAPPLQVADLRIDAAKPAVVRPRAADGTSSLNSAGGRQGDRIHAADLTDATTRLLATNATLGHAWRDTAAAVAKSDQPAVLAKQDAVQVEMTAIQRGVQPAAPKPVSASASAANPDRAVPKEVVANTPHDAKPMAAPAKDILPVGAEAVLKSQPAVATLDISKPVATAPSHVEEMMQRMDKLQQVVEKFSQSISTLGEKSGGSMTIEVTPASLGKVTLDCDVKDGAMSLKLVADSDAARSVLTDHTQAIRDVVQNAGYSLAQLDVSTREDGSSQRPVVSRQPNGARRDRKTGLETGAASAVSGASAGVRYDDGQEHALWLVA